MELIFNMAPIINYLKLSFVLFLFFFNIYLIFTIKKEPIKELKSGFGNKNLRALLSSVGYIGGFVSALITVKNEIKEQQIGKIDQLMETEREEIRRSIDKDKEEHQKLLNSIESHRDELYNLHIEKAKLLGHNDRLFTLHNSLKEYILAFKDKSTEPSVKLSELGILDQLIKQKTKKFGEEVNSLILSSENSLSQSSSSNNESSQLPLVEGGSFAGKSLPEVGDIKESSIGPLNFEISTVLGWFEGLNGIKKIAVSLILSKSVVLSALISIIFIFYGNILIEKYDLENKYPKLAKFIQLRQKFQKYYFKYYCFLIFTVIITEIAFGIAILLL